MFLSQLHLHTIMPSHRLRPRFYSTICYIQILLPRSSFHNISDTRVYLAEDSVKWQALSNTVSNILVRYHMWKFLSIKRTTSFSKITQLRVCGARILVK